MLVSGKSISRVRSALPLAVALLALAACDRAATGPDLVGPQDTTFEAIVTDPDLSALAADEAGVTDGSIPEEARQLLEEARRKFEEAHAAYLSGDREAAARLAEEGRLLLAEALLIIRGDDVFWELSGRLDHIITWLEERVEGDEVPPLLSRIRDLRAEAEAAWTAGDPVRAVERLLLALRLADHARLRMMPDLVAAARMSVETGASAIELARRTIGDTPTEVQGALMHRAVELQREARLALEVGFYRRAFVLGRHVVEVTLVAVLDAEFPDAADVAAMLSLADEVISQAEAVVGDTPTEAQARILEHAKRWQARALEIAEEYALRSVALFWRAAVLANLLV